MPITIAITLNSFANTATTVSVVTMKKLKIVMDAESSNCKQEQCIHGCESIGGVRGKMEGVNEGEEGGGGG